MDLEGPTLPPHLGPPAGGAGPPTHPTWDLRRQGRWGGGPLGPKVGGGGPCNRGAPFGLRVGGAPRGTGGLTPRAWETGQWPSAVAGPAIRRTTEPHEISKIVRRRGRGEMQWPESLGGASKAARLLARRFSSYLSRHSKLKGARPKNGYSRKFKDS